MASEIISKDTESHLTLDKLQYFGCPFTWEMESAIENERYPLEERNDSFEMVVDWQDCFPEFPLVLHLMVAYENTLSNKLENAMDFINKAEGSLADIKKKLTSFLKLVPLLRGQCESAKTCNQDIYAEVPCKISNSMCQLRDLGLSWSLLGTFRGLLKKVEKVLDRLFLATKCHVLLKLKRFVEADELFVQIYRHGDMEMDEIELAMLYGCKCLASYLYQVPKVVGIESAKKAIKCEPTNGKWYFLLGKSLRDDRRKYQSILFPTSQEEIDAFTKAVKLSKNPLFCISLAHLYRDSREMRKANDLYKDIYDLQPTNCAVRLQLALGFIRAREFELAKRCLDYAAEISPNSPKLAHYMGIYQEKCNKDLTAARYYYRIAVDKYNYAAEDHYTRCRKQVEPDWDPLSHWLEVVKNCKTNWQSVVQEVNVHIGMYYLNEKHDILSACDYLKKAIDIQPDAKTLKCHRLFDNRRIQVNIYNVLTKEIQRALKYGSGKYDPSTTTMLENTLQLCRKYNKDPPSSSLPTSTRTRGFQPSNYSQNRVHRFPSNSGSTRRHDNSNPSFRSTARKYSLRGVSNLAHNPTGEAPLSRRITDNDSKESLIYSDEDDDDYDIEVILRVRKPYTIRPRPDLLNGYDDEEFLRRFRFRKRTFYTILGMIEERIRNRTDRNHSVPPNLQLLLTLRYYATGTFQAVIGDLGGIHKSTTCRIIKKVTEAIASLRPLYINLPTTFNGQKRTNIDFYRIARFPRVMGAIDCTHVKLKSPGGQYAEIFRNRKGIFSLNVQAICNSKMQFMDIVARWPGSSHDSTIFNASRIQARFLNREMGHGILLGDNGYACSNIILTPLLQTNTRAQELYNESQIRTRNVIERAFGVWKRRFPVLAFGLRMRPESAQAVIVATAVLHNIALSTEEPESPVDMDILNALEELDIRGGNFRNAVENANVRRSLIENHFLRLLR